MLGAASYPLSVFLHASDAVSLLRTHVTARVLADWELARAYVNGAAVPLAGWSAYAQIRTKSEGGELVYDLAPVITADDADGLITIPEIPHAITRTLPAGDFVYDVIPVDPLGRRLDPIVAGQIKSSTSITQVP